MDVSRGVSCGFERLFVKESRNIIQLLWLFQSVSFLFCTHVLLSLNILSLNLVQGITNLTAQRDVDIGIINVLV